MVTRGTPQSLHAAVDTVAGKTLIFALWVFGSIAAAQQPQYQLYGLNFSPYRDGQSPGMQISAAQIQQKLAIVAPYTRWVRTYSSLHGIEQTCPIAHQMGLKCAAGASITGSPADNQELAALTALAKAGHVDLAIIGTEAMFHWHVPGATLGNYIDQFKIDAPGVDVTTADTYGELLNNPNVLAKVTVVTFNIYPFFEGDTGLSLSNSVAYINGWYQLMKQAAGSKQVVISETGWPDLGDNKGTAIASLVNSGAYFLNFVSWAKANNVAYFYFEAFDENWKISENSQGPHFGIFDTNDNLKPAMSPVFNGAVMPDNWTGTEPGGPGAAGVTLTYVPAWGSTANLFGQVVHLIPANHKIACYIHVGNTWYVKPFGAQPLTPIFADGTWRCSPASTGDTSEDRIAALVFANGATPPLQVNDVPGLSSLGAIASVTANRTPYGIAGTILDSQQHGQDGVLVSLSGAQAKTTQTANGGQYSFVDLNQNGNYTVTPSAAGAIFSPTSQAVSNLAGVQAVNFTATSHNPVISGQIADNNSVALGNATVQLSGSAAASKLTDAFGYYTFTGLASAGSYMVTPALNGYTFTPPNQAFANVTADQKADFTGVKSSGPPLPSSVNPAWGSTASQPFVFTYTDPRGWQDLGVLNILINSFLDGRQACYLAYVQTANLLLLVNDAGDAGGPFAGQMTLDGSATTIENSQCRISGSGSSRLGSGNTLTLTLNITFKPALAGNRIVYMAARDAVETNSGWMAMGTWQAPGSPGTVITVAGASPTRGTGSLQNYSFPITDTKGSGDLGIVNVLINEFIDGRHGCYLAYIAQSKLLVLVNDAGDAGGPFAGSLVLGDTGTIHNSQCTVGLTSAPVTANGLTLNLNIIYAPAFTGNKVLYVAARDGVGGNNTDWQSLGTWGGH